MRRLLALAAAVVVVALPLAATGQAVDWSVTIQGEHKTPTDNPPPPGATESFGQHYDVPADLVGLACTVTVHTVNNESVHDTDFYIDTDTRVLVVADIEDGAGKATDSLGTIDPMPSSLVMGFTLGHYNNGQWRTSITVQVVFDCQEPPSITTTTPTSTPTSSVPTTTTSPTTTSPTSSLPTVTSTSTTSTLPTTVPSSSTSVPAPSTTAPTGSSTTPSTLPPELPHTGAVGAGTILAAGVGLLTTGGFTAWRFRKRDA